MNLSSLSRRQALALAAAATAATFRAVPRWPAAADDTVTLWSWRTEDQAAMRRIFDVFEKENPGIKVDLQFTPDADYQNRLSTALRGGRGPDIAQLKAYGELQPFVEAGYLDAARRQRAGAEELARCGPWRCARTCATASSTACPIPCR